MLKGIPAILSSDLLKALYDMGHGETIVIEDGEMDLGEFGFIHFIDFDNTRARQRTVQVMVMGE